MGLAMTWIKEERLYPLVVLILIWIMAVRVPLDTDMWWHLRAGEETVAQHAVYQVDTFSSTRSGSEWINHSWLSQVLMYAIFRAGNFTGLSVWVAACAVISMGLVYLQMKGHPLLRGAVLLLAAVTSSVVWSPRPQIMSLVFLSLVTWLVSRYRGKQNWRILIWLLPIFTVWGNLHGGYVIGLIYLGTVLVGDFLDRVIKAASGEQILSQSLWILAGFTILSGLAVLINPFGIEMWRIPFNTIGVETLQYLINEWASPNFHQAFQQPMLWMVLGLMAVFALSDRKPSGREILPVLAFSWAAFTARRNFGPFAIVAAPVLSAQLALVADDWYTAARDRFGILKKIAEEAESSKRDFSPRARNLINLLLVGALLFGAGLKTYQVNQGSLRKHYEEKMFPLEAVSWVKESGISGNLFNEYNWGGYLIYRLPESKVFADGRTDLFGDKVLGDYLVIIQAEGGWEDLVRAYHQDYLLVKNDSCLAQSAEQSGWEVLYEDDTAVILGIESAN